jgi:Rrf2 family transcriptional regulator, nitric oxide-sensitive transcriptional repressor
VQLTLQTDYALRVLIHTALKGEELSTIPEIAGSFGISRGHVMKVVHRLGKLGYLVTVRGKGGGIRLARDPAGICVGAVVRDMEEELGVLGCLSGPPADGALTGYCRIEGGCVLRGVLQEATRAFLATLDAYTLADLIKPRRLLARRLGLDAVPAAR